MKTINFTFDSRNLGEVKYINFATGVVHKATEFAAEITLTTGHTTTDLKSILGIMALARVGVYNWEISISGKDEEDAYLVLNAYLSDYLGK